MCEMCMIMCLWHEVSIKIQVIFDKLATNLFITNITKKNNC